MGWEQDQIKTALRKARGDMLRIDPHIHSRIGSPCSALSPMDILEEALARGLDAVVITEHNDLEASKKVARILDSKGLRSFAGVEVRSLEGDILVYGIDEQPPYRVDPDTILEFVRERGGVAIAAHPFRNGAPSLGDAVYELELDGIEVLNGNCTLQENRLARIAAEDLGVAMIGGSDAHVPGRVGRYITLLEDEIESIDDLVSVIRSKRCRPAGGFI